MIYQQTIDKKLMVLKKNANKFFLLAPLARNHLNICQVSSLIIKATIIRSVITKKNTPRKILARSARSLSFIKNAKLLVSRLRSWLFSVWQIKGYVASINMWFTNKLYWQEFNDFKGKRKKKKSSLAPLARNHL